MLPRVVTYLSSGAKYKFPYLFNYADEVRTVNMLQLSVDAAIRPERERHSPLMHGSSRGGRQLAVVPQYVHIRPIVCYWRCCIAVRKCTRALALA